MSDPRNVAHSKKVEQEKEHQKPAPNAGAKPKRGRRKNVSTPGPDGNVTETAPAPSEVAKMAHAPGDFEKSEAVLSKLKEMEFHSRANIETLAELTLTIEEELKQKEFSEPIGALYGAQDGFQTKIAALIESYEAKCASLREGA